METRELKAEQKRITAKISMLERVAEGNDDAQLQIEFLREELKWINIQLSR